MSDGVHVQLCDSLPLIHLGPLNHGVHDDKRTILPCGQTQSHRLLVNGKKIICHRSTCFQCFAGYLAGFGSGPDGVESLEHDVVVGGRPEPRDVSGLVFCPGVALYLLEHVVVWRLGYPAADVVALDAAVLRF
ncbi:hypothetical protein CEXT_471891 [Caerostris extrusa]|uniref:Uncharacterized protein n=1 Tax=Caerostris extrusa TaxID=172846 RepID=A0AAV4RIV1_CAEEX|nr:hypothetical protein CEXT_471891 [Caerostris extrusa]